MSADWVATVALGILFRSVGNSNALHSFWAPFLLLHLGGPDNITAYSLEDNELWLRHLLGLVFQTGVAVYVFGWSWVEGEATLNSIAIPVFIAGIIKYGERNYALMSSSSERFRAIILKNGPNELHWSEKSSRVVKFFFMLLRHLYASLVVSREDAENCNRRIRGLEPREAFKLVEFELGLLYDLLFTKARIVYSSLGMFFRFITCLASVSALVTFSIIIHDHEYSPVDISLTYLLLVGAVVLEVYALLVIVSSEWTKLWLDGRDLPGLVDQMGKRWSRSIPRFNLFKFCIKKKKTMHSIVEKLFGSNEILEKHQNVEYQQGIDEEIEILIFKHLYGRIIFASGIRHLHPREATNIEILEAETSNKVLNSRGNWVLEEMNCLNELKWSTVEVEFEESILLWHIATQICYHDDIRTNGGGEESILLINDCSKISRCLSEYMLYLFVLCSNMLPKGFGYSKFKQVCGDLTRLSSRDMKIEAACLVLLDDQLERYSLEDPALAILMKGCALAKKLQNLEPIDNWGLGKKWEMMKKVWVEILTYAAGQCEWNEHAQQLAKGGQLCNESGSRCSVKWKGKKSTEEFTRV